MAISLDFFLTEDEKIEKKTRFFENPYKKLAQDFDTIDKKVVLVPENLNYRFTKKPWHFYMKVVLFLFIFKKKIH